VLFDPVRYADPADHGFSNQPVQSHRVPAGLTHAWPSFGCSSLSFFLLGVDDVGKIGGKVRRHGKPGRPRHTSIYAEDGFPRGAVCCPAGVGRPARQAFDTSVGISNGAGWGQPIGAFGVTRQFSSSPSGRHGVAAVLLTVRHNQ